MLILDLFIKRYKSILSKLIAGSLICVFAYNSMDHRFYSMKRIARVVKNNDSFIQQVETKLKNTEPSNESYLRIGITLNKKYMSKPTSNHVLVLFTIIPPALLSQLDTINKLVIISFYESSYPNGVKNILLKDKTYFVIHKQEANILYTNDIYNNEHKFTIKGMNTLISELPIAFTQDVTIM
jgi:hypothetical protein